MSVPSTPDGRGPDSPGDRLNALLRTAVDEQVQEQRQLVQLMTQVHAALARQGTGGSDAVSLEDLHDGLAGMRTDLRVLPEQIGPAVAGAVGNGLGSVARSLDSLEDAQAATARDLVAMRTEIAETRAHLSQVPAVMAAIERQLAVLASAQAAVASAPRPPNGPNAVEIAGIVREGVRDATRDFVRDYLRDAVRDIVTVSTRDTERRITDHVDEAVLALAQALLVRRPSIASVIDMPSEPVAPEPGPVDPLLAEPAVSDQTPPEPQVSDPVAPDTSDPLLAPSDLPVSTLSVEVSEEVSGGEPLDSSPSPAVADPPAAAATAEPLVADAVPAPDGAPAPAPSRPRPDPAPAAQPAGHSAAPGRRRGLFRRRTTA